MSHISLYEAHEKRDQVLDTPLPSHRGRRVHDFIGATAATPLPKNYLLLATPGARRIENIPDLVAEIEEENPEGEEGPEYKSKFISVSLELVRAAYFLKDF